MMKVKIKIKSISFCLACLIISTVLGCLEISVSKAEQMTPSEDIFPVFQKQNKSIINKILLEYPSGMAIDSKGNIFIADRRANLVYRLNKETGELVIVAGTGERSFDGDGGLAIQAKLAVPEYVAIDSQDNLYIADRSNSRIRKVDVKTGIITTVAGNGKSGYSGDGVKATEANISYPYGLALDKEDNIFIADTENQCIRRVDAKTGIITTVAGNGIKGFSGDGEIATKATFSRPHVLTIAPNGDLVIGDSFNQRIRRVDKKTGIIKTIAGSGEEGTGGEGENPLQTKFTYFGTIIFDSNGDILLSGGDRKIRKINLQKNTITTVAELSSGLWLYGLVLDNKENIFAADPNNKCIWRIDSKTQTLKMFVGN